jgi:sister chromatid cohesion protein DCC1
MKSSDNWDPFRVCLKGTDNCEAVLCTSHETYLIRQADTSNTLLLVNDSFSLNSNDHQKVEVKGPLHSQIELQKTLPRVDQLRFLLLQNPLYFNNNNSNISNQSHSSSDSRSNDNITNNSGTVQQTNQKDSIQQSKKTYTTEELLDLVQASPHELRQALDDLNAFQYEGILY